MPRSRKDDFVSLDDLDPFDLEGTPEDIARVERGLAIMARKQVVWASVVEGWKKRAGISTSAPATPSAPLADARQGPQSFQKNEHQAFRLAELVRRYQSDEESPFHKLRYRTRENYRSLLRRVVRVLGSDNVADIDESRLRQAYEEWSAGGHMALAHSIVAVVRILATYGATVLARRDCRELQITLRGVQFERTQKRNERLTAEQARAIISHAHAMDLHSIALAQALQFDCTLKQKDVIGEWVPEGEPGISQTLDRGNKWLHGIDWREIDQKFILRHVTSTRGKPIEINLLLAPMVVEELCRLTGMSSAAELIRGMFPDAGPVIVSEYTELPYWAHEFRRRWRLIATAAGVPKNVYNMDSRPNATNGTTEAENQPL